MNLILSIKVNPYLRKKKKNQQNKNRHCKQGDQKSTLKSQATFVFRLNICHLFHFISKNALFSTRCLFYCSQEHLHSIFLKLLDLPVSHVTSKTTQRSEKVYIYNSFPITELSIYNGVQKI